MRALPAFSLLVLLFAFLAGACSDDSPPSDGDAELSSEEESSGDGESAGELDWDDLNHQTGLKSSPCYSDHYCRVGLACVNHICVPDGQEAACEIDISECPAGYRCGVCVFCDYNTPDGNAPGKCVSAAADGDADYEIVETDACTNDLDCPPYEACGWPTCTPPKCYCGGLAGQNPCKTDADCEVYGGVCKLTHDGTALKCVQPGTI